MNISSVASLALKKINHRMSFMRKYLLHNYLRQMEFAYEFYSGIWYSISKDLFNLRTQVQVHKCSDYWQKIEAKLDQLAYAWIDLNDEVLFQKHMTVIYA